MPEINEIPITARIVEIHPPGVQLQKILHNPNPEKPYSYADVSRRVEIAIKQTAAGMANATEEHVRQVIMPVFFGPLLLDQKKHAPTTREGEITDEDKDMNARIQHSINHSMFFALTKKASPRYLINQYDFARRMQLLCDSDFGTKYNLTPFWNGLRSELAIMHALSKGGYRVVLPDYTQQRSKTPPQENQVLQWDIRNGTDCIAFTETGESATLVDAKGRADAPAVKVQRYQLTPDDVTGLSLSLQQALKNYGAKRIYRAQIIVPTSTGFAATHLPSIPRDSYQDAFRRFSSLKDDHTNRIISELKEDTHHSQLPLAA